MAENGTASAELSQVIEGLTSGRLIPYLAPELIQLDPANADLPARTEQLVQALGKGVPIPGRLRKSLSASAQYIETYRHRKVLRTLMCGAFARPAVPSALHRWLASLHLALIVDLGYDNATALALAENGQSNWGQIQGVSRAESRAGQGVDWFMAYDASGEVCSIERTRHWVTLLYKPLGSVLPAGNFLVSDADFVEVLTEIDIQTPIPDEVQARRAERGFVFIGCRFASQHHRTWAKQISKRSQGPHVALIDGSLTKNETRFCAEHGISVLEASAVDLLAAVR